MSFKHRQAPAGLISLQRRRACASGTFRPAVALQTIQPSDGRSYGLLAAVTGPPEWDRLRAVAAEIPRTVHQVNRVVYLLGPEEVPATFAVIPTLLDPRSVGLLREADDRVKRILERYAVYNHISQVIVTLFPVDLARNGGRSVGLRPFMTNDYMTGSPTPFPDVIPWECVEEINRQLRAISGISGVVYDLTSKPPATMEWE